MVSLPTETMALVRVFRNTLSSLVRHEPRRTVNLESKKEQVNSKIEYNEDKINTLVYQLYDLTDEEITIVEKR